MSLLQHIFTIKIVSNFQVEYKYKTVDETTYLPVLHYLSNRATVQSANYNYWTISNLIL